MRTAYVITEGSYSDYSIVTVFLDQAKAEKFVEMYNKNHGWLDARIEEHVIGEQEPIEMHGIHFRYYCDGSKEPYISFSENVRSGLTNNLTFYERLRAHRYATEMKDTIVLERYYTHKPDEKTVTKKMTKIAQDIWTQVQEKIQIEGLTPEQVNAWLKGLPIEEDE